MQIPQSLVALALIVSAAPTHAQDHRRLGAHEHGVGRLDVATEANGLLIALDGPAANIVGFEHRPRTPGEIGALNQAIARLRDGTSLFTPPPSAGCRLVAADVDTALANHQGHQNHEDHHDDDQAHADIEASWRFHCDHPEALTQIGVGLFEAFPSMRRLQVQFIAGERQGGAQLDPANHLLRF